MSEQTSSICVGCKWAKWEASDGVCRWPAPVVPLPPSLLTYASQRMPIWMSADDGFAACPVREPQEAQP